MERRSRLKKERRAIRRGLNGNLEHRCGSVLEGAGLRCPDSATWEILTTDGKFLRACTEHKDEIRRRGVGVSFNKLGLPSIGGHLAPGAEMTISNADPVIPTEDVAGTSLVPPPPGGVVPTPSLSGGGVRFPLGSKNPWTHV